MTFSNAVQGSNDRLLYMDAMRSVLMTLGVILHSAQIYNPEKTWVIYSERQSELFLYIIQLIGSFRMPAFFVVSGFFCAMLLRKRGPAPFIQSRAKRIIIPFLVAVLLINSLQTGLLTATGWKEFELHSYIQLGEWVQHLWFLINLLIYILVLFLLNRLWLFFPFIQQLHRHVSRFPVLLVLALMPILSIMIIALSRVGVPVYFLSHGLDAYSILTQMPYFLFGVLLFANKTLLNSLLSLHPLMILSLIPMGFLLAESASGSTELHYRITEVYAREFTTWLAIALCFYIFFRYFNKDSRFWKFLSEASYSVYLTHQVFIVSIGAVIIKMDVPSLFGFLFLVSLTFLLTVLIHKYVISRHAVMRLLLNGK